MQKQQIENLSGCDNHIQHKRYRIRNTNLKKKNMETYWSGKKSTQTYDGTETNTRKGKL